MSLVKALNICICLAQDVLPIWIGNHRKEAAMSGSHDPFKRSDSPKRENRECPRFPSHFRTFCQSIQEDDELLWSVQVEELSRQGVKIISHRRFEPGTILRIGLIHEKARVLMARAIRVSPSLENDWVIACSFPKELEDDEFQSWVDPVR